MSKGFKKSGILAVVLLLLVVVVGGYTYSRYMSSATANSDATMAKWSVKIGANDLDTYTTSSPLAANLVLDANANVADGVIAPGRSGKFTVEIDPSDSQVAIDYNIKVKEITGIGTNSKIKVSSAKYWVGDKTGAGTDATVTGDTGATISETLTDVLGKKKVTVEITVAWENDESNNTADTASGKTGSAIAVKTEISAKQRLLTD